MVQVTRSFADKRWSDVHRTKPTTCFFVSDRHKVSPRGTLYLFYKYVEVISADMDNGAKSALPGLGFSSNLSLLSLILSLSVSFSYPILSSVLFLSAALSH